MKREFIALTQQNFTWPAILFDSESTASNIHSLILSCVHRRNQIPIWSEMAPTFPTPIHKMELHIINRSQMQRNQVEHITLLLVTPDAYVSTQILMIPTQT